MELAVLSSGVCVVAEAFWRTTFDQEAESNLGMEAKSKLCVISLRQERQLRMLFASLWKDEAGAVISAELALVLSILVLGVIVGLSEVAVAVNTELNDISNAVGALDQSYFTAPFCNFQGKNMNFTAGNRFTDRHDDCDKNQTCDLVCGPPMNDTCG